jgi:alanine dehydrogenase
MKIGIPQEIMTGEGRVSLTPAACESLVSAGHCVYVQMGAGQNSAYTDENYRQAGAELVESAKKLYEAAQYIVKVKQPLEQDLAYLRSDHVLFCYLHLAADLSLVQTLSDIGLSAVPFESITDVDGALPLLAPMSQVAGRIAVIRGASLLFRNRGGRGVLLGGVDGSDIGRVVVLGAGVAGRHAVGLAASLGARVDVLDLKEHKLQSLKRQYPAIETHISTAERVESLCVDADLVIGAVLLAGRRAPVILKTSVVKQMNPGSVIVDIAIDQGGCVEGIHPTSSEHLCYMEHGVIHSAVPNMPAAVARTSSQSLSSAILPYVKLLPGLELSSMALDEIAESERLQTQALQRAVAVRQGEVVDKVLLGEIDAQGKVSAR